MLLNPVRGAGEPRGLPGGSTYAWVIDQSFLASGTSDPLLTSWARNERPFIEEVVERSRGRCALVPWSPSLEGDARAPALSAPPGDRRPGPAPASPDVAAATALPLPSPPLTGGGA